MNASNDKIQQLHSCSRTDRVYHLLIQVTLLMNTVWHTLGMAKRYWLHKWLQLYTNRGDVCVTHSFTTCEHFKVFIYHIITGVIIESKWSDMIHIRIWAIIVIYVNMKLNLNHVRRNLNIIHVMQLLLRPLQSDNLFGTGDRMTGCPAVRLWMTINCWEK